MSLCGRFSQRGALPGVAVALTVLAVAAGTASAAAARTHPGSAGTTGATGSSGSVAPSGTGGSTSAHATSPTTATSSSGVSSGTLIAVVALGVLLVLSAGYGGWRAGVSRRREIPHEGNAVRTQKPDGDGRQESEAARERDALALACIQLLDLTDDAAVLNRLAEGLRRAGIEAVDATGERFDPELHQAVGSQSAPTPAQHNEIAATRRLGYVGHGETLRQPEVYVYRTES